MLMKQYIEKCLGGAHLSADEASAALDLIMSNQATEAQIAGLLIALRAKGESVSELVGFARMMRERAVRVQVEDPDAIDMCGTGGDGLGTFNISTVASFVAAGAGVTVAKHGNRSVSSKSGSADLLVELGINIQLTPERTQDCINAVGVGFLFAPLFHPAMKHVSKTRTDLGVRTIFNMLGPITNPAGVHKQLIGTYHRTVARNLASALSQLNTEKACVVNCDDGMDEVGVSGDTKVFEVEGAKPVRDYAVSPSSFGLCAGATSSARGGTPTQNAAIARSILGGERTPARDLVVANAAFGIYVAGKARNLKDGAGLAAESIDSGRAMERLQRLTEYSNRL